MKENRDPRKRPFCQLIFDKGAKAIQWNKNSLLTNDVRTTGHSCAKKIYLDTDLKPLIKINSKLITDLNVKRKTMKLLEDNIGENLNGLGYGDAFLDTTPKPNP